jgi:signal transduction histidine kinase
MSLTQSQPLRRWDGREMPLLNVLPYVLLVISTAMAVGIDHGDSTKVIIDIGGATAAAAWMLWFITLHPRWEQRRVLMGVFFAGLMAIAAVLVLNDPIYGFFSWTGYIWIYRALDGRWRIVGLLVVAMVTGTSQHGGLPGPSAGSWITWILIVAVNCFVYSAIAWMIAVRDHEHELRAQALADLTEANAKLEASMRENAGLHEQLLVGAREAGILDERQRMAREIHDTLAQGLVGIITQLEAAAQGGQAAERHTDVALELARESLTQARRSVQALAPSELEQVRLPEALAAVAAKWSELSGVEATTTTTGAPVPMRPEIEVALLRTAQEALANVTKHARASRVAITLSYMHDVVTLDVSDDGSGFSPTSPPSPGSGLPPGAATGGFGLVAMHQRVEGLGGELAVESEPGRGTTIAAGIPLIALAEAPRQAHDRSSVADAVREPTRAR